MVNAIAAHHKEVEPVKCLCEFSDDCGFHFSDSSGRVRTSSVDGYYQRVKSIELIAKEQKGVDDAYAIQAGKELRVIVKPEVVDDAGCRQIARRIRSRIENAIVISRSY